MKDSGGATLATYGYDGLNRRVRETASGTTTDLYYSSAWQVLEEDVSGSAVNSYVWSPVYVDALIARDRDTDANGSLDERLYAMQDANFNVTGVIDTSGTVQERYLYDPYGSVTYLTGSWGSRSSSSYDWIVNFQGLRYDAAAGQINNRRREIAPTLGRENRLDPVRFKAGDFDLYRFEGNAPTARLDPSGLQGRPNPSLDPGGDAMEGYLGQLGGLPRPGVAIADVVMHSLLDPYVNTLKLGWDLSTPRMVFAPGLPAMNPHLAGLTDGSALTPESRLGHILGLGLDTTAVVGPFVIGGIRYANVRAEAPPIPSPSYFDPTLENLGRGYGFAEHPWTLPDGSVRRPPNNGFEGTPESVLLPPGLRVDRYGLPAGRYVSPEGTPISARSLAPGVAENSPYHLYEIMVPVPAESGIAVPWFGQPGRGIQYRLPYSVQELLDWIPPYAREIELGD